MSTLALETTATKPRLWRDPPRRVGLERWGAAACRLARRVRDHVLTLLIDLLGALSAPGAKNAGRAQSWALRRMGARCASPEIWLGPGVRIDWPHNLVLGARITINPGTRITCHSEVVIGDDFLAAPGLLINSGTHDLATLQPASAPVIIGPGVWCGARVTLCAGVTVGAGAVIGAGAVVVRDIPAHHVALGIPARPVRDISRLREETGERWSNFSRA